LKGTQKWNDLIIYYKTNPRENYSRGWIKGAGNMAEDFRTELRKKLEEVKDKEDFEFIIEINKPKESKDIPEEWRNDG
jgi:hypothetical protein